MAARGSTADAGSVARQRERSLALERMPTTWCPGCGDGIVVQALLRAFARLGLEREVALVAGIGCFGHAGEYLRHDFFHALHGRALPTATGLKLARPDLRVVVLVGDGDGLAIGGNHLIHAARRNLDLTVIMFNNAVYGRTGGQYSPTTGEGSVLQTAPYGMVEPAFDPCEVALGAGASHVSRITVYHALRMVKVLAEAIEHPGFAFVEVITNCHVMFGRYNDVETASEMIRGYGARSIGVRRARELSPEALRDRIVIGNFRREHRPELGAQMERLRAAAAGRSGVAPARGPREVAAAAEPAAAEPAGAGPEPEAVDRLEVALGGTGGQGLQLAGALLAEAAGVEEGRHAVQAQDYGPAIRGGVSTSEVVISDRDVEHPRVERPHAVLALSPAAFAHWAARVRAGGLVVFDPELVEPEPRPGHATLHPVPAREIARSLGKPVVTNVVALGALGALLGVPSLAALEAALARRAPPGTERLNREALRAGFASVATGPGTPS